MGGPFHPMLHVELDKDTSEPDRILFFLPASNLHYYGYAFILGFALVATGVSYQFSWTHFFIALPCSLMACGVFWPHGSTLTLEPQRLTFRRRYRTHTLYLHSLRDIEVRETTWTDTDRTLWFLTQDGGEVEGPRFEIGDSLAATPEQIEDLRKTLRERIRANADRAGTRADIPASLRRTRTHAD